MPSRPRGSSAPEPSSREFRFDSAAAVCRRRGQLRALRVRPIAVVAVRRPPRGELSTSTTQAPPQPHRRRMWMRNVFCASRADNSSRRCRILRRATAYSAAMSSTWTESHQQDGGDARIRLIGNSQIKVVRRQAWQPSPGRREVRRIVRRRFCRRRAGYHQSVRKVLFETALFPEFVRWAEPAFPPPEPRNGAGHTDLPAAALGSAAV